MREFREYGSARGALSNERPYRDHEIEGALDDALRLIETQGAPDDDALNEMEWEA